MAGCYVRNTITGETIELDIPGVGIATVTIEEVRGNKVKVCIQADTAIKIQPKKKVKLASKPRKVNRENC